MIRSFRDRETEIVWSGRRSRTLPPDIQRTALRKMMMLHRARTLHDLRVPPANMLESLKGKRQGQWSIRINRQWRICFRWNDGDATDVEIVDYHDE
jgi:proteic killer suppression protein